MTLDELIETLRRARAAHPTMATEPARSLLDVYTNGEYSHESYPEIVDVWASTDGVVTGPRVMRSHARGADSYCSRDYMLEYERTRGLS